jgi:hypothetical protein
MVTCRKHGRRCWDNCRKKEFRSWENQELQELQEFRSCRITRASPPSAKLPSRKTILPQAAALRLQVRRDGALAFFAPLSDDFPIL